MKGRKHAGRGNASEVLLSQAGNEKAKGLFVMRMTYVPWMPQQHSRSLVSDNLRRGP